MTLGSLFDGSGGFPLAGTLSGITPIWASEVEPYPIAVTRSRFPRMKHLGSVTDIDGGKICPVDVVTFGSPCQDMSIAGKRAGIHDGQRSNLFFEAVRVIKEMRQATNEKYPKFAVWENVPGAFSSSRGEDFRCALEAFAGICAEGVSVPQPKEWKNAGELSVLECVGALSDAGVMIVTGAPIQRTPVGMPLNVDATRGDMLKTLLSAVESAGISGDISEINVANEQNLYCVMRGGLVFRLGDITNIENKLAWITPMQRQLLSEGRSSGTVDVTGVTSADYIPPSATPEATALPGQMLPTATFVPFDATPQPTQAA